MRLGVNIDHVATLREARGTDYPSPLEAAALCEKGGADGITIHLREDRRHIQDADLFALRPALTVLREAGILVSLFIEPSIRQLDAAVRLGAPVVELHTGTYCNLSGEEQEVELLRLVAAAKYGNKIGLQINAGHGLNLENLPTFLKTMPHLDTLNIGHSIVARAVLIGMEQAVHEMKALIPQ